MGIKITILELRNERTKECLYWTRNNDEFLAFRCPATEFEAKRESTELKEGQRRLEESELGAAIDGTYQEEKSLQFNVS